MPGNDTARIVRGVSDEFRPLSQSFTLVNASEARIAVEADIKDLRRQLERLGEERDAQFEVSISRDGAKVSGKGLSRGDRRFFLTLICLLCVFSLAMTVILKLADPLWIKGLQAILGHGPSQP